MDGRRRVARARVRHTEGRARPSRAVAAASPFVEFDRGAWSRLAATTPLPLTDADVVNLRGLGDPLDLAEVDVVYRPLSGLLQLYAAATRALHQATSTFLGERATRTPYVIGVAGSVAVGKSSTARLLRELLRRWPQTPRVELVTTDGFLYPNAELERRGLLERKGFPESYDRRALLRFVADGQGRRRGGRGAAVRPRAATTSSRASTRWCTGPTCSSSRASTSSSRRAPGPTARPPSR